MTNTVYIYGIKNCDTMKKAFKWLEEEKIAYDFRDYKKGEFDADVARQAIDEHGWETVINKRGTTWRKLDDAEKENMDAEKALITAEKNPSLIKRPLVKYKNKTYVGFDQDTYQKEFL